MVDLITVTNPTIKIITDVPYKAQSTGKKRIQAT